MPWTALPPSNTLALPATQHSMLPSENAASEAIRQAGLPNISLMEAIGGMITVDARR